MSKIAASVGAYLASLPHISNVEPVSITIKGTTYEGAAYDQTLAYSKDMDAVRRGERKEGEAYTRHSIYLVGELPACYRRSSKTCFTFEGDSRDWYVASHMDAAKITKEVERFHPFGGTFQIAPWDIPGSAIDQHEPRPYARVPAIRRAA